MASPAVSPLISVIMAVYNGAALVERALRSVQSQTFSDWELVAVDDASLDTSGEVLARWAAADPRIRVARLAENSGLSAARNAGLRLARGEFITYLDHDDEYYPDYLEHVAALRDKGDLLMLGFDLIYDDGPPGDRITTWDPTDVRKFFFSFNPVVPLAVAHRRSLWAKAGGFNEMLWLQEDWDLWKRMARAGAKIAFSPAKSGRYHVRPGSLSNVPRLTVRQREAVEANWRAGRPIFASPTQTPRREPVRKIAFVSPRCVIDFTDEAATATRDALRLLADEGFDCQVFCGTQSDELKEGLVQELLAQRGTPNEVHKTRIGPYEGHMIFTLDGKVPVTLFENASTPP